MTSDFSSTGQKSLIIFKDEFYLRQVLKVFFSLQKDKNGTRNLKTGWRPGLMSGFGTPTPRYSFLPSCDKTHRFSVYTHIILTPSPCSASLHLHGILCPPYRVRWSVSRRWSASTASNFSEHASQRFGRNGPHHLGSKESH